MRHEGRKNNPKAYELAKECGVTARELLQAATALGLPLQNRLTRINPAAAERIRKYLAGPRDPQPHAAGDDA